jgi:hypothetical protein
MVFSSAPLKEKMSDYWRLAQENAALRVCRADVRLRSLVVAWSRSVGLESLKSVDRVNT